MRRRIRTRDESGFTLVELLVSMTIFSLLMAVILSLMISMMTQASDTLGRQRAVEQARLGLSQIDKQVRSGNVIADPSAEDPDNSGAPTYFALRIYTQEGGVDKCAQWRVVFPADSGFGQLEYRQWDPTSILTVTDWSRVASNVVKPKEPFVEADPTTWPPFVLDAAGGNSDAQSIRLTLRMDDQSASTRAKAQVLTTVVTGRNTVYGYSSSTCSVVPAP